MRTNEARPSDVRFLASLFGVTPEMQAQARVRRGRPNPPPHIVTARARGSAGTHSDEFDRLESLFRPGRR